MIGRTYAPMLAAPLHKGQITDWKDWRVEEKYDGHRLMVRVSHDDVEAWTRPRRRANGDKTADVRTLPVHLTTALSRLPVGVYDGELVGGDTSTDVTRLDLQDVLTYIVFDILEYKGAFIGAQSFTARRSLLEGIFHTSKKWPAAHEAVKLTESRPVASQGDIEKFVETIWARGGEGAILKDARSPYLVGKRSPTWLKLKKLHSCVMTVVGFEATRGAVMNRGAFAIVILEDAKGNRTTVKTKDDAELARFARAWDQRSSKTTHIDTSNTAHPALGRKLRIEYQDRTRDGGYRHPRWDRWEDE